MLVEPSPISAVDPHFTTVIVKVQNLFMMNSNKITDPVESSESKSHAHMDRKSSSKSCKGVPPLLPKCLANEQETMMTRYPELKFGFITYYKEIFALLYQEQMCQLKKENTGVLIWAPGLLFAVPSQTFFQKA